MRGKGYFQAVSGWIYVTTLVFQTRKRIKNFKKRKKFIKFMKKYNNIDDFSELLFIDTQRIFL